MDSKRSKIERLAHYIQSLGVVVNIGKTKARGNKGLFIKKSFENRIDIAENLDEASQLNILLHEFAHYIHSLNDSHLKSLDFIFGSLTNEEMEELINITVSTVSKDFARSLYKAKEKYADENKRLVSSIKKSYPDFRLTHQFLKIENKLDAVSKYLLKYDRVNYLGKVYSLSSIRNNLSDIEFNYINLKQNYRKIASLNSKINRLNKYYNQPTELWARFFELFFTNHEQAYNIAPILSKKFGQAIVEQKIPEISKLYEIINI